MDTNYEKSHFFLQTVPDFIFSVKYTSISTNESFYFSWIFSLSID